jgi:predicted PurR-regulated permease PerM
MVNREHHFSKSLRFLIGVAALGVAVVTIQPYAWLLNTVFVGVIIAVVSAPMLHWLRRKGLSGGLAVVITLLVLAALATAFVLFVVVSVNQLGEAVPTYVEEAESLKATAESTLAGLGIDTAGLRAVLDMVDPSRLFGLIVNPLAKLADSVSHLVVVVLVVAFLLAETLHLPAKVQRQLRLGHTQLASVSRYIHDLRGYVLITAELAALTGIGVTILLLILGVDLPILWGMLAFLLSFIPTVGLFLAMIPPALLALLEFGPVKALLVVAGFLLIDAVVENVVKPKVLGESLDISPVVIILSLIFWTAVLGPMGALLAVPLTLAIKELVLETDEDNQWVAELMSSGEDAEAPDDAASEDKPETDAEENA